MVFLIILCYIILGVFIFCLGRRILDLDFDYSDEDECALFIVGCIFWPALIIIGIIYVLYKVMDRLVDKLYRKVFSDKNHSHD